MLKQCTSETLAWLVQDLDELRQEIDDDEYDEIKSGTKEQLQVCFAQFAAIQLQGSPQFACSQEIETQLNKLMAGDVSLVTEFGAMRLALQAAIADAFQTPEVIRLFAKKEPDALRTRLAAIQQDHKLTRLPFDAFKCVPPAPCLHETCILVGCQPVLSCRPLHPFRCAESKASRSSSP